MNNAERIRIWYDDVGNFLTVTWDYKFGYYTGSDDDRVLVHVDMEGNVQGFMVHGFSGLKDQSIEVRHDMDWWNQLDKRRGSRPRCVLIADSNRGEVAKRLTRLVGIPEVVVSANDNWIPYGKPVKGDDGKWDTEPADEAQFGNPRKPNQLVKPEIQRRLTDWWFAVKRGRMTTPNWDIASTCTVQGNPGLLLVEAKAHAKELQEQDRCGSKNQENRERIRQAIAQASTGLESASGNPWNLSRDSRYQLSNRFAWSWKLASLGIPVVLVYLGFLNAQDIADRGPLFQTPDDWEQTIRGHCQGVVDNNCWGKMLDIDGVPFTPLIRTYDQPFNP